MCERDSRWIRQRPDEFPLHPGPLGPIAHELWSLIATGGVDVCLGARRVGDHDLVPTRHLVALTGGLARFSDDTDADRFVSIASRFECVMCPTDSIARRCESGAAQGDGWAAVWHIEEISRCPGEWDAVDEHLFVATTLDRAGGQPVVYHAGDSELARPILERSLPPCPPSTINLDRILGAG